KSPGGRRRRGVDRRGAQPALAARYDQPARDEGASPMTYTVLLYSDDPQVRDRMRLAIGSKPAADLSVEFTDAASYGECLRTIDTFDIDLVVLDGEATPAGGVGIARQLRDEVLDCPPIALVIARAAD